MKAIDSPHYLLSVSINKNQQPNKEAYPFNLPVAKNLKKLEFHPKVTFIVGENGSGKSTLLEAIAIGMRFNPEGGSRNFNFKTRNTHSNLHEFLTLTRGVRQLKDGYFLRAESFYNVASEIERLDAELDGGLPIKTFYGGKSLHEQSHGESFMSLMEHRFGSNGLYILDEPEAALSPARQLKLLALIHKHTQHGAQFIIATHSPILIGYPEAVIYLTEASGLHQVKYEETEHYQLTKYFLMNRDKVLGDLLSE